MSETNDDTPEVEVAKISGKQKQELDDILEAANRRARGETVSSTPLPGSTDYPKQNNPLNSPSSFSVEPTLPSLASSDGYYEPHVDDSFLNISFKDEYLEDDLPPHWVTESLPDDIYFFNNEHNEFDGGQYGDYCDNINYIVNDQQAAHIYSHYESEFDDIDVNSVHGSTHNGFNQGYSGDYAESSTFNQDSEPAVTGNAADLVADIINGGSQAYDGLGSMSKPPVEGDLQTQQDLFDDDVSAENPGFSHDLGSSAKTIDDGDRDIVLDEPDDNVEPSGETDFDLDDPDGEQEQAAMEFAQSNDELAGTLEQQRFVQGAENNQPHQFAHNNTYGNIQPPKYLFSNNAPIQNSVSHPEMSSVDNPRMRVPLFGSIGGFINRLVNKDPDPSSIPDLQKFFANNLNTEIERHQRSCLQNQQLFSELVECSKAENSPSEHESQITTLVDRLKKSNQQLSQNSQRLNRLVRDMPEHSELLNRVNETHSNQVDELAEQLQSNQEAIHSEAIKELLANLIESIRDFVRSLTGNSNDKKSETETVMEPV